MSILTRGLQKSFGDPPTLVLKGIDLEIQDGEFVSIVGKSGCGKSTLLYILSTLDAGTQGSVQIDGIETQAMSQHDLHRFRNRQMGFVFQFHHLLPELSALENVMMPVFKNIHEPAEIEQRRLFAIHLFQEFDLAHRHHHRPSQLSGGEQQRVAIARALIMEPKYLFADEPTGNLDSANGAAVMNLLKKINTDRKMTVLFVTHDPDFAAMSSRQIHMSDGKIISG